MIQSAGETSKQNVSPTIRLYQPRASNASAHVSRPAVEGTPRHLARGHSGRLVGGSSFVLVSLLGSISKAV